jgi:hypothetical protein
VVWSDRQQQSVSNEEHYVTQWALFQTAADEAPDRRISNRRSQVGGEKEDERLNACYAKVAPELAKGSKVSARLGDVPA